MTEEKTGHVNDEQVKAIIEDGGVNLGRHELLATKARFDAIRARVPDPKSHPAEICRLIAFEIVMVIENMLSRRFTADDDYIIRGCVMQVKALREIGKQVLLTELLRRKEDVLNFDGEKFKFVMGRFIELFVEAMKQAGVPDDLNTSVMRHYRDLLAENEPRIRCETEKLNANERS
jgi:hypothetical protein